MSQLQVKLTSYLHDLVDYVKEQKDNCRMNVEGNILTIEEGYSDETFKLTIELVGKPLYYTEIKEREKKYQKEQEKITAEWELKTYKRLKEKFEGKIK